MNRKNAVGTNKHGIDETEIDGNTKYMDNPELFTEVLEDYMSTVTLHAGVTPTKITHIDPGGLTVQRVVNVNKDSPVSDDEDEATALWKVYQKAVTTYTLKDADGTEVFPNHTGCQDCGTVEETPITQVSACSDCSSADLSVVAVPEKMKIEQRIPFIYKHTPVLNDDDLRLAIGPIFDHTV